MILVNNNFQSGNSKGKSQSKPWSTRLDQAIQNRLVSALATRYGGNLSDGGASQPIVIIAGDMNFKKDEEKHFFDHDQVREFKKRLYAKDGAHVAVLAKLLWNEDAVEWGRGASEPASKKATVTMRRGYIRGSGNICSTGLRSQDWARLVDLLLRQ